MLSLTWPLKLFVFALPFGFVFYNLLHRSHNVCMQCSHAICWLDVVMNPLCFSAEHPVESFILGSRVLSLKTISDVFTDFIRADILAVWHIFLDFPVVGAVLSISHLPSDFPKNWTILGFLNLLYYTVLPLLCIHYQLVLHKMSTFYIYILKFSVNMWMLVRVLLCTPVIKEELYFLRVCTHLLAWLTMVCHH